MGELVVTASFFEMGCIFFTLYPEVSHSQSCPAIETCSATGNSQSLNSQSHHSAPAFPLPWSLPRIFRVSGLTGEQCCSYTRGKELQCRFSSNELPPIPWGAKCFLPNGSQTRWPGSLGLLSHTADACMGREESWLCGGFPLVPACQRQKDADQAHVQHRWGRHPPASTGTRSVLFLPGLPAGKHCQ